MIRFLLLSDSCGFDVGCSVCREARPVVYNCCWFLPAQSFSGASPEGLMTIFNCHICDFPNLEGQVCPVIHPGTGFPFCLLQLAGLWWGIQTFLHVHSLSKSKSHYDRQSVGQSIMVPGAHLGPATNLSFSLRFSFRQLLFVIL
jgi:hypothetical protein